MPTQGEAEYRGALVRSDLGTGEGRLQIRRQTRVVDVFPGTICTAEIQPQAGETGPDDPRRGLDHVWTLAGSTQAVDDNHQGSGPGRLAQPTGQTYRSQLGIAQVGHPGLRGRCRGRPHGATQVAGKRTEVT